MQNLLPVNDLTTQFKVADYTLTETERVIPGGVADKLDGNKLVVYTVKSGTLNQGDVNTGWAFVAREPDYSQFFAPENIGVGYSVETSFDPQIKVKQFRLNLLSQRPRYDINLIDAQVASVQYTTNLGNTVTLNAADIPSGIVNPVLTAGEYITNIVTT